jgi:hypothetical protein
MRKKTKIETARFVHAHLDELAQVAREAGLGELAYLVEVAALEAERDGRDTRSRRAAAHEHRDPRFN